MVRISDQRYSFEDTRMTRFLIYMSYIGTKFRSVQKQSIRKDPTKLDPDSVQGILEICSKRFKPENEPCVYVSSRTDQGVHALCTTAHVDLVRRNGQKYDPLSLVIGFNHYFKKNSIDIRVQKVETVPDTFHARYNAKSRTYLYRLAVRKPDAPLEAGRLTAEIPYIEWNRCHFIQKVHPFDISLFKKAATLFPGTRDFRTFMGSKSKLPEHKSTVKEMYRLDVVPGRPLIDPHYCPSSSYYDYWDIICHSQSFVYRQIRRIVGALIAVAQGKISIEEIKFMLDTPSKDSWNNTISVAPGYALYLLNVEYDPLDLIIPKEEEGKEAVSTSCSEASESYAEDLDNPPAIERTHSN